MFCALGMCFTAGFQKESTGVAKACQHHSIPFPPDANERHEAGRALQGFTAKRGDVFFHFPTFSMKGSMLFSREKRLGRSWNTGFHIISPRFSGVRVPYYTFLGSRHSQRPRDETAAPCHTSCVTLPNVHFASGEAWYVGGPVGKRNL